ncbi:unnamed protein product [Fusarium venenatum]|uniref:Uncharacterized protein n=1 Tax=Fusarium venenatum TaxID=56646 RepID=A0A2L2SNR3_9HYPO|nr:uncharacterized protein FVRRES_11945 [Fusarium venenatum]CEI39254.1 unnamed protein product [Fusarium venenatum]
MRNRDLTGNPYKSGIGKTRPAVPGDKAELRTTAVRTYYKLISPTFINFMRIDSYTLVDSGARYSIGRCASITWFRDESLSSGRCKTISILKGTTDRRSRAQTTPIASLTPKPGEMWTFVFETAGGGTHRQPSWTTLKLNTSRGSQSTQLSELMTLWVFNCRDLLARCNVCTYDAFEETRYRCPSVPSHNGHVYETF